MRATELAQSLIIFTSYDKDIEVQHTDRYSLYGYQHDALDHITVEDKTRLLQLGWQLDADGSWILPD